MARRTSRKSSLRDGSRRTANISAARWTWLCSSMARFSCPMTRRARSTAFPTKASDRSPTGALQARLFLSESSNMKKIATLVATGAALVCLAPAAASAGDAKAGRQKITTCQACHGLDGLSKNPEAPNLAGQIESYLVKALTEYKAETRK